MKNSFYNKRQKTKQNFKKNDSKKRNLSDTILDPTINEAIMTTISATQSCMNEHIKTPLFDAALLCNSVKYKYPIEDTALSMDNTDDVALCFLQLQRTLSIYLSNACIQEELRPAFLKCMEESNLNLLTETKQTFGRATLGGVVKPGDTATQVLEKMKQSGSLDTIFAKYVKTCGSQAR